MKRIFFLFALLLTGCASDGTTERPQVMNNPSAQATAASAQTIAPITSFISN